MTETQRRKFLKLIGVSLAGAAGVSILGCEPRELRSPTRQALANRLRKLARSKPPTRLVCATCYVMAPRHDIKEPCPECRETMILGEKDKVLSAYHVALKRIQDMGLDTTLTVPVHCPTCGRGLNEKKFLLEIRYPDDPRPVRVELDEAQDLELMAVFLRGEDRYHARQCDLPLKDKVERLRELFGVQE